eukprot:TRINITY_DN2884_c0_g1_i5.p1 TRINITY_DN2884_c0_g1~~TRINITY_DN2884_c0_g1_i5.p1  ORF type:complete len:187 (-),score=60.25 TRINITY_DN2884_c0_g1_i5:60-560(-)
MCIRDSSYIDHIIMAERPKGEVKKGWGFDTKADEPILDTSQKTEKRQNNIWEQKGEDLIVIPDVEEESNDIRGQVSAPPVNIATKVTDLSELLKSDRQYSLPQLEEGVDLSLLMNALRPADEIFEKDEGWHFQGLKTEIYEIVSNLYGNYDQIDEDGRQELSLIHI